MKYRDEHIIHSGYPKKTYINVAIRHCTLTRYYGRCFFEK
jgi:hypothetical protein